MTVNLKHYKTMNGLGLPEWGFNWYLLAEKLVTAIHRGCGPWLQMTGAL